MSSRHTKQLGPDTFAVADHSPSPWNSADASLSSAVSLVLTSFSFLLLWSVATTGMGRLVAPVIWEDDRVYERIPYADLAPVLLCGAAVLCVPFALVVARAARARRRATSGDLAVVFTLPVSLLVIPVGHVVLRPRALAEAGVTLGNELLVGVIGLVGLGAALLLLSVFVGVIAIPYDRVRDDSSWYY